MARAPFAPDLFFSRVTNVSFAGGLYLGFYCDFTTSNDSLPPSAAGTIEFGGTALDFFIGAEGGASINIGDEQLDAETYQWYAEFIDGGGAFSDNGKCFGLFNISRLPNLLGPNIPIQGEATLEYTGADGSITASIVLYDLRNLRDKSAQLQEDVFGIPITPFISQFSESVFSPDIINMTFAVHRANRTLTRIS